jgi:hypothetical protein
VAESPRVCLGRNWITPQSRGGAAIILVVGTHCGLDFVGNRRASPSSRFASKLRKGAENH